MNKYILSLMVFIATTTVAMEKVESNKSGHFGLEGFQHDQMSEFDRMYYWSLNQQNQRDLVDKGVLTLKKGASPLFAFPLRTSTNDPGFYGISNFVDLDTSFPNSLQDYNCGTRTYDLNSGYNHQGIDIFTWPFGWDQMDRGLITVHAAASGTITAKFDGNFDRNCTFNNDQWNAVFVTHEDGSVAWYGHMKKNSLTSKSIGQTVVEGEYLGTVGSSGSSTGPHLHLETYNSSSQLIEPYSGACNSLNNTSWWQSQTPYYDSKINKLATHAAGPTLPSCPTTIDNPQYKDNFVGGEIVYLARYYQDQLQGQVANMVIRRPNGSVFQSWSDSSNVAHYSASYWWNSYALPVNAESGEWIFETTFQGVTNQHKFYVNDVIFASGFE